MNNDYLRNYAVSWLTDFDEKTLIETISLLKGVYRKYFELKYLNKLEGFMLTDREILERLNECLDISGKPTLTRKRFIKMKREALIELGRKLIETNSN